MIILWILLGGFAYRIRGGLLDPYIGEIIHRGSGYSAPNNYIRSIWALYITILIGANSPYLEMIGIFLCALLGVAPSYWAGKFDLTLPENRNWRNYAWLTVRGAFVCLPLAIFLSLFGMHQVWFGVAAGSCFVVYYLLGIVIHRFCKIQGPSQWGEWCLGILIGLSLSGGLW